MKTTMELILGGASQGKEAYAKEKYKKALVEIIFVPTTELLEI